MPRALLLVVTVLLLAPPLAPAQSLGDLAAREKARRDRDRKARPPRVYTDQDLQKEGDAAASATAGEPAANPGPPPASPSEATPSGESSPPGGGFVPDGERQVPPGPEGPFVARRAEAQAALDSAQQVAKAANDDVERLRQDLNPMSTTFTNDPYQILKIEAALAEARDRQKTAQEGLDAAQKAMDDLREEARRAGVRLP
jgi:hypothetical protein